MDQEQGHHQDDEEDSSLPTHSLPTIPNPTRGLGTTSDDGGDDHNRDQLPTTQGELSSTSHLLLLPFSLDSAYELLQYMNRSVALCALPLCTATELRSTEVHELNLQIVQQADWDLQLIKHLNFNNLEVLRSLQLCVEREAQRNLNSYLRGRQRSLVRLAEAADWSADAIPPKVLNKLTDVEKLQLEKINRKMQRIEARYLYQDKVLKNQYNPSSLCVPPYNVVCLISSGQGITVGAQRCGFVGTAFPRFAAVGLPAHFAQRVVRQRKGVCWQDI